MQELTNQLVNKESFPTHPLPSQHSTSSFLAPSTHPPHPQIHNEYPLSLKQPYWVRSGNPRLRGTQRKCKLHIHNLRPSSLSLTMTKSSRRKSFKTSAYLIQIGASIIKADPGLPSAAPEAVREGAGKSGGDFGPGSTRNHVHSTSVHLAGFVRKLKWWEVRGQTKYRNVFWSFPNIFQD